MADEKKQPAASETILRVASTIPGPEGSQSWFALHLPTNLDLHESFEVLVWHIEFRRKCMNQGFDNLIELLMKTRDTTKADIEAAVAEKQAAD